MTTEQIDAWTRLGTVVATIVTAVCGMLAMRWKLQIEKLRAEAGKPPAEKTLLDTAPLVMFAVGGTLLAYLLSQNPQLAQMVLPLADSTELSSAMPFPSAAACKSTSDCAKGCSCTGGECTPCSATSPDPAEAPPLAPANKSKRGKSKPRLVADIGSGTLCTGCDALPQMLSPISQPFER